MIVGVWQNTNGKDLAWKFVQHNWQTIIARYGAGGMVSRLISSLGVHTNKKTVTEAKKFFAKNKAPAADRTLAQSYERIYSNDAWLRADKTRIKKWLDTNYRK